MSTRAIRPRSVDIHKPLLIIRKNGFLAEEDDVIVAEESKKMIPIMTNIPTPEIKIIDEVQHKTNDFVLSNHFIKSFISSGAEIPLETDKVTLLEDDHHWLSSLNGNPHITTSQLEAIMEFYEKQAFLVARNDLDPSTTFPKDTAVLLANKLLSIPINILSIVYSYWVNKRLRIGNATIRRFSIPPASDNPSPLVAFRPRKPVRRISNRTQKKDNAFENFLKLKIILADLEHVLKLLSFVLRREYLKKEMILLKIELFDEKLAELPFIKQIELKALNRVTMSIFEQTILGLVRSKVELSDYGKNVLGRVKKKKGKRNIESESESESEQLLYEEVAARLQIKNYYDLPNRYEIDDNDPFVEQYVDEAYKGRVNIRWGRGGRIWLDRVDRRVER